MSTSSNEPVNFESGIADEEASGCLGIVKVKGGVSCAYLPGADKYGNESQVWVYKTILTWKVAGKINWENAGSVVWDRVWTVAFQNPAFA
ncbi:MAG TPA: hypothetical protein VF382_06005 [Actinomycetota bacterium]